MRLKGQPLGHFHCSTTIPLKTSSHPDLTVGNLLSVCQLFVLPCCIVNKDLGDSDSLGGTRAPSVTLLHHSEPLPAQVEICKSFRPCSWSVTSADEFACSPYVPPGYLVCRYSMNSQYSLFHHTESRVHHVVDEEDDGTDDETVIENLVNHIHRLQGNTPFQFIDDPPSSILTPTLQDHPPFPPPPVEAHEPPRSLPVREAHSPSIFATREPSNNPRHPSESPCLMTHHCHLSSRYPSTA